MVAPNLFYPNQMAIFNIVRGNPTVIATVGAHNYVNGLVVRIDIPPPPAPPGPGFPPIPPVNTPRGMYQLNGTIAPITVTGANLFTIPIDSTGFDPFVFNLVPRNNSYLAQVIPISEDALTLTSATHNNNNIIPEIFGTPPAPQTI